MRSVAGQSVVTFFPISVNTLFCQPPLTLFVLDVGPQSRSDGRRRRRDGSVEKDRCTLPSSAVFTLDNVNEKIKYKVSRALFGIHCFLGAILTGFNHLQKQTITASAWINTVETWLCRRRRKKLFMEFVAWRRKELAVVNKDTDDESCELASSADHCRLMCRVSVAYHDSSSFMMHCCILTTALVPSLLLGLLSVHMSHLFLLQTHVAFSDLTWLLQHLCKFWKLL